MYDLISSEWKAAIAAQRKAVIRMTGDQEEAEAQRLLNWLEETEIRCRNQRGAERSCHVPGVGAGYPASSQADERVRPGRLGSKYADHPFRLAIVCAMWMTGFDVESLATLYVDKPMRSHTLMQTIAWCQPGSRGS